jgi:hypothetical protein
MQGAKNSQNNLKAKTGDFTLPDINTYFKVAIIKRVCLIPQNRQIEEWNRMGSRNKFKEPRIAKKNGSGGLYLSRFQNIEAAWSLWKKKNKSRNRFTYIVI